ncbi:hypothetical protein HMPREF9473_04994 [ [Hungatella hathewayi WAL-18680]|uniref:Uncharacterized protein n=1 Tax=Hungatella hathewayi WAL-18680 TaxID=742737 RepID=G5INB6_9FIRM|nr:hypothetical protein HMPREF9473_04994 [ [Hungatella hathewayi WAL-18680]
MNFNINSNNNKRYLDCTPFAGVLSTESDAMELISACFSNNTENLLLHERSVSMSRVGYANGMKGELKCPSIFKIYNCCGSKPELVCSTAKRH